MDDDSKTMTAEDLVAAWERAKTVASWEPKYAVPNEALRLASHDISKALHTIEAYQWIICALAHRLDEAHSIASAAAEDKTIGAQLRAVRRIRDITDPEDAE